MMSDWKHNTDGHTGSNPIVKGSNLTVIISQHSFKTFQNLHFYHHSKKYIQLDSFFKSHKLNWQFHRQCVTIYSYRIVIIKTGKNVSSHLRLRYWKGMWFGFSSVGQIRLQTGKKSQLSCLAAKVNFLCIRSLVFWNVRMIVKIIHITSWTCATMVEHCTFNVWVFL